MLAASKDYTQCPNISKLPWYEDGFLIDPCDARDMRNEQYVVLSHYLETLISNIQTAGSANNEIFNAVIGNLQDFKSACDCHSDPILSIGIK